MTIRPILAAIALASALAGAVAAQSPEDPGSIEAGAAVYEVFCRSCHGAEGRGDGPFGDLISVAPADLTQLSARNGGAFPTFEVMRRIDGRDPVEGHGVIMPVFGPLFDVEVAIGKTGAGQPVVTSRSIIDLAAWIESIQEK